MSSPVVALALDAHDPARTSAFWAALLGREVRDDRRGALLPGSDGQVGLRFVPTRSERSGPDRVHLHLTTTDLADQEHTVAAALELGACHLDVGQLPDEEHVVLADPEGNAFCVIEPGNSYLAGCGLLAELACDGTREVGLFWSAALGWPLVWDQDEQTAVQSPSGGTKIAWGGPPLAPKHGRNRQRLDLTVTSADLAAAVDHVTALGAVRLGTLADDVVELADPDGNEFWLSTA